MYWGTLSTSHVHMGAHGQARSLNGSLMGAMWEDPGLAGPCLCWKFQIARGPEAKAACCRPCRSGPGPGPRVTEWQPWAAQINVGLGRVLWVAIDR
jgi:hypothetical protein